LIVGLGDVAQPGDKFEHVRHALLVVLMQGRDDLDGLAKGFVALGQLLQTFVDSHIYMVLQVPTASTALSQRHPRAIGTSFDLLILRSLVSNGTRWTMLVAAIDSSAGSLTLVRRSG
jgi:hypothetical protein